jgi:hypothetical protein
MFYIPALILSAAGNVGDPTFQVQKVVSYIKQTWPFFNRSMGADHAIWLPGDYGACSLDMKVGHGRCMMLCPNSKA